MVKKYNIGLLNGNVCTHTSIKKSSIGIKNNKILKIGKINSNECTKIIDCNDKYILPGIIDTQVHFREPGLSHKEDINSGTKSAILGGVTTIFEMPNTSPATINKRELEKKLKIAKNSSWTNYSFFIGACKENLLNLSKLEKIKGCAGIKIFMGSSTGTLLLSEEKDLETALRICKRRVAIHSEDEERLKKRFLQIKKKEGVLQHEYWRDTKSAVLSTKRVLKYANKYNTKAHILHISTKDEINLLRRTKKNITCEVTPQHLSLFSPNCYESLGSKSQMNPPIRNRNHQKGLWEGISDGTVNVIGSDHAPHTLKEKSLKWPNSPSGLPGVQTSLHIMLDFVSKKKLSLEKVIELLSYNPAKIYNIKNKGQIKKYFDADITIVDLNKSYTIKDSDMAYKCRWTPFHGKKVKGDIFATIINGKIKMINKKILGKPNGKVVLFNK
ncbi:MAG: dihydroorotase [Pseudomonadota bacterium]|nr:dihydroorotase [Pseudomonadota bacterium]